MSNQGYKEKHANSLLATHSPVLDLFLKVVMGTVPPSSGHGFALKTLRPYRATAIVLPLSLCLVMRL